MSNITDTVLASLISTKPTRGVYPDPVINSQYGSAEAHSLRPSFSVPSRPFKTYRDPDVRKAPASNESGRAGQRRYQIALTQRLTADQEAILLPGKNGKAAVATNRLRSAISEGQLFLFEEAKGVIKHADDDFVLVRLELGDEEYVDQTYRRDQLIGSGAPNVGQAILATAFITMVPDPTHVAGSLLETGFTGRALARKKLDGTQRL